MWFLYSCLLCEPLVVGGAAGEGGLHREHVLAATELCRLLWGMSFLIVELLESSHDVLIYTNRSTASLRVLEIRNDSFGCF